MNLIVAQHITRAELLENSPTDILNLLTQERGPRQTIEYGKQGSTDTNALSISSLRSARDMKRVKRPAPISQIRHGAARRTVTYEGRASSPGVNQS